VVFTIPTTGRSMSPESRPAELRNARRMNLLNPRSP
jgi:hypothetical protein